MPYALIVAMVGMLLGNIGTAYGLPAWAALLLGVSVLFALLHFKGERVSRES
jgi:peptidoglycan biosynthesis protein MviN/MurJ (putative lipid II flippase)